MINNNKKSMNEQALKSPLPSFLQLEKKHEERREEKREKQKKTEQEDGGRVSIEGNAFPSMDKPSVLQTSFLQPTLALHFTFYSPPTQFCVIPYLSAENKTRSHTCSRVQR